MGDLEHSLRLVYLRFAETVISGCCRDECE